MIISLNKYEELFVRRVIEPRIKTLSKLRAHNADSLEQAIELSTLLGLADKLDKKNKP